MSAADRRFRRRSRPPVERYEDQPYIRAQLEAFATGAISRTGATDCYITHDSWCDLLNGRGFCNCDPEVRFVQRTRELAAEGRPGGHGGN